MCVYTGESGSTVCVSSPDNLGTNYYEVQTGVSTSFSNVQEGFNICISKPGFIPIITTYNNNVYIQNETITSDRLIISNDVYGGSDVTTTKPQGSVTIQSGSTEIYGTNGVLIKNDFEVKNGASLKIVMGN